MTAYDSVAPKLVATFTRLGEPVSKARARFTKYKSKTHAYTPQKTLDAEKQVADAYTAAGGQFFEDDEVAFRVVMTFHNATRQRRDVDNMMKLILDGLNGVAWVDDVQVLDVVGKKRYVSSKNEARTEVEVFTIGTLNKPKKKCLGCHKMVRTYSSTSQTAAHCSRECAMEHRIRLSQRVCAHCQKQFVADSSTSKAIYCSRKCTDLSSNIEVICNVCDGVFLRAQSVVKTKNFCSVKCRDKDAAPRRAKAARGTCKVCGGHTSKKIYERCMNCRDKASTWIYDKHTRELAPDGGLF